MASSTNSEYPQNDQVTEPQPIELFVLSDPPLEVPAIDNSSSQRDDAVNTKYLQGWGLYSLTFGLCLSLLLSTLETTIVSTSLVSITNALQGFENRDWVVTSYLLTYTGFLVIYTKFSDIFGSKFMILLALIIFTVFSIACGAATAMTELIVLRALQGVGGSGIYSMVGVIVAAVVHPAKFSKIMAIVSSVFAIASILGPLLGGAINDKSTWRWVFLLNAPAGAAATALIIFLLPSDISTSEMTLWKRLRSRFTIASFRRLDLVGFVLMLAASVLLVFALEEAGTRYAWASAAILASIILAIASWAGFIAWEIYLEKKKDKVQEPIFPMRLLKDRILVGMLLNAFFAGFPFTTIVVNIPQRFQAVNGSSPTRAGLFLLPLLLLSPFASGLAGFLGTKGKIPPLYLIVVGSCLQFLGVGLTSSLSNNPNEIEPATYGYEVIMGLGFGLVLTSLLGMIPLVVKKADMPVMIGPVTQVRVLGGTIGLAVSSTVLNGFVKGKLSRELSGMQIAAISQSLSAIGNLTSNEQIFVRTSFAEGYNHQTRILTVFSGLVVASSLLMWERNPRRHRIGEENEENTDT